MHSPTSHGLNPHCRAWGIASRDPEVRSGVVDASCYQVRLPNGVSGNHWKEEVYWPWGHCYLTDTRSEFDYPSEGLRVCTMACDYRGPQTSQICDYLSHLGLVQRFTYPFVGYVSFISLKNKTHLSPNPGRFFYILVIIELKFKHTRGEYLEN